MIAFPAMGDIVPNLVVNIARVMAVGVTKQIVTIVHAMAKMEKTVILASRLVVHHANVLLVTVIKHPVTAVHALLVVVIKPVVHLAIVLAQDKKLRSVRR